MSGLRIFDWQDAPEAYQDALGGTYDFVAWAPEKVEARFRWKDQVRVTLPDDGGELVAGNNWRGSDAST